MRVYIALTIYARVMVMVSAGLKGPERRRADPRTCPRSDRIVGETGTTSNDPDTPGAGVARTCHVIVKSDFWRSDDATRHPPRPGGPGSCQVRVEGAMLPARTRGSGRTK